jgi:ABC-type sugar transport system ATPase subunit
MIDGAPAAEEAIRARVKDFSFFYGEKQALKNLNFVVRDRRVTALIGPSGCGKSTLLRAFNRMHDLYPGNRYQGEIILYPEEINAVSPSVDPMLVRLKIGMVFQKPNPFPKSIYENVAAGLWIRGIPNGWSGRCGRRRCGTRSRTGCGRRPTAFRAGSSSASVSPGRWRRSPKCCCSTSRPRPSIRSRRRGSKS